MSVADNPAKSIFLNALEISGGQERKQYIDKQCGEDETLRGEVERLLQAAGNVGGFMESPPDEMELVPTDVFSANEQLGGQIGPYRLMEQIGEGGMGVVYVAQQERPMRRRVALKVIKPGMDSKEIISRFEAERQALALMDHPNIAAVLDAGTTDSGLPYFVMELVRGIPITEYCDLGRFDTSKRLQVFLQVCQAVQHAHQKGIIHRDIKPSNVLITEHDGAPVVKVIDFGVAKALNQQLTDRTIYTRHLQMVGTPLYMSPEQAELSGLDVDTRSDIYSLGVLLYELLTGATPFEKQRIQQAGFDEFRRIIREEEPSTPSTKIRTMGKTATTISGNRSSDPARLCRDLRGDLDWVVMKCLEKDRARRYDTANGLVMDLQRHLKNEPVAARPPSVSYRLQKAWRRNRAIWITGITVLLAVFVGMGLALAGWYHARQQRNTAVEAQWREEIQRERAERNEQQAKIEREKAIALKEMARQRAYAAEMNIAFQAEAENNLYRVRELLDRQRPETDEQDLRGFEWRYLWGRSQGDQLESFPNESSTDVAFSPNGKWMAFAHESITVRDVVSRKQVAKLPTQAITIDFSPESDLLAAGHYGYVELWDTSRWAVERKLKGASFPAIFSPDGHWLVTGGPDGYQLWSTRKWEKVGECGSPDQRRAWNRRHAVAFSPDSNLLFTPDREKPGRAQIVEIPSLEPLPELKAERSRNPGAAAFSADGKQLLVGATDGSINVWDVSTGELSTTLQQHSAWVTAIEVSPDGNFFASTSSDRLVIVWDAETLTPRNALRGHVAEVWALAISPDSRLLATGSQNRTAMVWDASKRQATEMLPGETSQFEFLADGGFFVWDFLRREMRITDRDGHTTVQSVELPSGRDEETPAVARITASDFRPGSTSDRLHRAIGHENGNVEVWMLGGVQIETWQAFDSQIAQLKYSPDGKFLAAGTADGRVKVWSVLDRCEVVGFAAEVGRVHSLAFSPDSTLLAVGGERPYDQPHVTVWNVETGQQELKLRDHKGFVRALEFSPDGKLLAVGTVQGNNVVLWEIPSGKLIGKLRGHLQHISDIDFTSDGRTLATGSGDGRVKLWNVAALQQIATFHFAQGVASVEFSPDDEALAVRYFGNDTRRSLRLISSPTWAEIDEPVGRGQIQGFRIE